MPSHSEHEILLYPALVAIVWAISGVSLALIFTLGIVVGTLWLSPDLDTDSAPRRRWWLLSFIWAPYERLVPHRSPWSHWPVLGTAGRLLYLGCIPCAVLGVLAVMGKVDLRPIRWWCLEHDYELVAAVAGLEASAMLHWLADWGTAR